MVSVLDPLFEFAPITRGEIEKVAKHDQAQPLLVFRRQTQVKIDQRGKFVIVRKGLKQVIRRCGGVVALAEVQIADYNDLLGTDWMFQWRDPISQNGQNALIKYWDNRAGHKTRRTYRYE